jgi:hypothetical protein
MKIFALIFNLFLVFSLSAQKTMDVKLILKYRNNPLCNWDVTIKNGDATIAKSKSNEKGEVVFRSAKVFSLSIDAYGYKAIQGGEKKWDVKGYIQLNDQGFADFDFEPLVKETGMPVSMLEAAWGLTLTDCGQTGSTPKSEEKSVSNSQTKSEETKPAEEEEKYSIQDMQQDMKQGIDNAKIMHENKIANLTSKIDKKTKQRNDLDIKSKEYSELSYEIRDLQLEREISKIKLEKVNIQIAKGYKPLNKSEKEPLESKEDAFSEEQKTLKKKEKEGYFFGSNTLIENANPKTKEETTGKNTGVESKSENKSEQVESKTEVKKNEKEDKEETKFYSATELSEMSVLSLKRYKLECNTFIGRWKLNLKTKSSMLTPKEIENLKSEIILLENEIVLIDTELLKRSETKE